MLTPLAKFNILFLSKSFKSSQKLSSGVITAIFSGSIPARTKLEISSITKAHCKDLSSKAFSLTKVLGFESFSCFKIFFCERLTS